MSGGRRSKLRLYIEDWGGKRSRLRLYIEDWEGTMNYLEPSEYAAYGLEETTAAAWVLAASAMVDAHCRRTTLAITQYTERLHVDTGQSRVRVTYLPLVAVAPATSAIVSARARYASPRRGEWPYEEMAWEAAAVFGLPGTWTDLNVADLDVFAETGEVRLPVSALGWGFSEIEIAYTAGLDPVPNTVKVACAQLVKNLQATPALNVRKGVLDRMQLMYFSDSLLDASVRQLLAPFVAQKVG